MMEGVPEGDTVWQTAARLHAALAGNELTRCDLRVPRLATIDLTGRRVESVRACGTDARTAVGYRLPVLDLLRTAEEVKAVGHLGPDLLDPAWNEASAQEALRRLRDRPDRTIGEALVDQRNLAGLGNVYKSELCFVGGVTPWTRVADVPDLPRLVDLAHRLLEANRERPMRVTTGETRAGRTLWVYGRKRGTCLRCGTPVRSGDQGTAGEERVTYWCPHCQAGPAPASSPWRGGRDVQRGR